MDDKEIVALLRGSLGKLSATEMVRLLATATGGELSHFSVVLYFKLAFRSISINVLHDVGAWRDLGDAYMSEDAVNELMRPWLEREAVTGC